MATNSRVMSSAFGYYPDRHIVRQMPLVTLYGGNIFWVDSNGAGGSRGTFRRPCPTLAAAMALCTANNSDTIIIKAGHTETVTGAGGITLAKAGINIHGLGKYETRPTFLMDGDAITGLVTGANITITNCVFSAGHAAIACAFLVTAKGFTMDSCMFIENDPAEDFVAVLNAGAVHNDYDGLVFSNNVMDFTTAGTAVLSPVDFLYNSKDCKILGNKICGDFDTTPFAAIYSVNTAHHFNCEIAYNLIHNQHDADGGIAISFGSTTSTGWIHHNLASANDIATATPFVSGANGMRCFENYYSGDNSTSGFIMPAIGAN